MILINDANEFWSNRVGAVEYADWISAGRLKKNLTLMSVLDMTLNYI